MEGVDQGLAAPGADQADVDLRVGGLFPLQLGRVGLEVGLQWADHSVAVKGPAGVFAVGRDHRADVFREELHGFGRHLPRQIEQVDELVGVGGLQCVVEPAARIAAGGDDHALDVVTFGHQVGEHFEHPFDVGADVGVEDRLRPVELDDFRLHQFHVHIDGFKQFDGRVFTDIS